VVKDDVRFLASYSIAIIKPDHQKVDSGYLALVLCSDPSQEYMRRSIRASGQPDLGLREIRSLPVPLPPLNQQRTIVKRVNDLLTVADRLEARVAKAREQVDTLTQSILAKAFRGELVPTEAELARAEGRSYESAEELLARLGSETEAPRPTKKRRIGASTAALA
jgi:type I restriction enzyme S subunit